MSIDVFVSYHKDTGLETARAVVQKLEAQGLRCWYQERDSGGHYASVISRMVAACGVFVVVLSQDATKSKFVKSELTLAYERDGLEILPLRISEDKLSHSATFYLSGIHWIDAVERPMDAALEDLCTRALKVLGRSAPISGAVIPTKTETIRYNDGCVYTGQVVNGKRHGFGKMTWPSGDVYEGDFDNDTIHGKGKYTFAKGTVFEGEWRDGKRTGWGKYIWSNGNRFEGELVNDVIHGTGKFVFSNGNAFEGEWHQGKRTGKGRLTWFRSGSIYEGDWLNDQRTGWGRLTWGRNSNRAGDVYEGDFVNGKRTGKGTYTYADGRIKSGRWKDGKFLG